MNDNDGDAPALTGKARARNRYLSARQQVALRDWLLAQPAETLRQPRARIAEAAGIALGYSMSVSNLMTVCTEFQIRCGRPAGSAKRAEVDERVDALEQRVAQIEAVVEQLRRDGDPAQALRIPTVRLPLPAEFRAETAAQGDPEAQASSEQRGD